MRTRSPAAAACAAAVLVPLLPGTATAADTAQSVNATITASVSDVTADGPWATVPVILHSTGPVAIPGIALGLDPRVPPTLCGDGTLIAGGDLGCEIRVPVTSAGNTNTVVTVLRGYGMGMPSPLGTITTTVHAPERALETRSLSVSQPLVEVGTATAVEWTVSNPNATPASVDWAVGDQACPASIPAWSEATCTVNVTSDRPGRITGSLRGRGSDSAALTPIATAVALPTATVARAEDGTVAVSVWSDPSNVIPATASIGSDSVNLAPGEGEVIQLGHVSAGSPIAVNVAATEGTETVSRDLHLTAPAEIQPPAPAGPVAPARPSIERYGDLVGVSITNPAANDILLWVQAGPAGNGGLRGVEPGETVEVNAGRAADGTSVNVLVATDEDLTDVIAEWDLVAPIHQDRDRGTPGCTRQNSAFGSMTEEEAAGLCRDVEIPGPETPEPTTPGPTPPAPTTPAPTTTTPRPTAPVTPAPPTTENPPVKVSPPHRITRIESDVAGGGPRRSAVPVGLAAALVAAAGLVIGLRRRGRVEG